MTGTTQTIQRKMASADDLHGIVRSMKALALANISQFEQAVDALNNYTSVIETGLGACFRENNPNNTLTAHRILSDRSQVTCIVFGSDHGLVGQFNDIAAEFAQRQLNQMTGEIEIHAVGERAASRLISLGLPVAKMTPVPGSVSAINPLIGSILLDSGEDPRQMLAAELHVIFNQPTYGTAYEPVIRQVLPFDQRLRQQWTTIEWPNAALPQIMGDNLQTIGFFLKEFLFVTLYRACALSLASENASRLAAMQRADKNIDDLMQKLRGEYHGLRQREIDDDLFDVIAGYDAIINTF